MAIVSGLGSSKRASVSGSVIAATMAAGALLAAKVFAQAPGPEVAAPPLRQVEAPQGIEEVVVRGQRLSEIASELRVHVDKFVKHVAAPPAGRGYARWHRRVCVSVTNLDRDVAQYLVDRISLLATEVGLDPGEPGCWPQVTVIFALDGKQMAASLVDNRPRLLRPTPEGGMDRGLEAMHEFAESDKPVRWWYVSEPVDARFGTPAMRMPGEELSPTKDELHNINVIGPSRIHSGIRDDLQYTIIIVDGPKLQGKGTTWQQLGDYLALVALAQIDLGADLAEFDSILNLFSNPAVYSGLTDWDRSYIHGLYAYDQEREVRLQRNELVGQMVRREVDSRK